MGDPGGAARRFGGGAEAEAPDGVELVGARVVRPKPGAVEERTASRSPRGDLCPAERIDEQGVGPVTVEWVAAAAVIALASFVLGLVGFGNGLVAMALLPFLMSPLTAIAVLTIYTIVFSTAIVVPVRRHLLARPVLELLAGTAVGAPVGVWILSVVPIAALTRLIGGTLVAVVVLEWAGLHPRRLAGRGWRVGAGVLAGMAGATVGTPGPPVIIYSATQGWNPRTIKANLQAFFVVNQIVILAGYWWVGVLDDQVWRLAASFAVPAAAGTALGMLLFSQVDHRRFRQLVFALLLVAGILLIVKG